MSPTPCGVFLCAVPQVFPGSIRIYGQPVTKLVLELDGTNSFVELPPNLALSSDALAGDRARFCEAGCGDFDTKPGALPRLLEKLEAFLHRKPAT